MLETSEMEAVVLLVAAIILQSYCSLRAQNNDVSPEYQIHTSSSGTKSLLSRRSYGWSIRRRRGEYRLVHVASWNVRPFLRVKNTHARRGVRKPGTRGCPLVRGPDAVRLRVLRRRMKKCIESPPNFERLVLGWLAGWETVLGCITADLCN